MIKYQPPAASNAPRFSGIRTFMRLPHVKTTEDIDFAIVGIPFDTGTSFKIGTRFGPSAIREESMLLRNASINLDVDIYKYLSGVDYGDLPVLPGDIHASYDLMKEGLAPLFANGVIPVVMGGDHSITLGELRAAAEKYGPVALLHFDSHLDTWDNYWGLKYTHGTPFRRACEEGLIDTAHSLQIGIRGTQYGPEDIQGSRDLGLEVITATELSQMGIKEAGQRIRDRVGDAKTFLTFDIDFLDPAYAPGTGCFEVEGFSGREAMSLLREAKDLHFIGMDLVEVLPSNDSTGATAYLAANIMHEFLSIIALQKKNGIR